VLASSTGPLFLLVNFVVNHLGCQARLLFLSSELFLFLRDFLLEFILHFRDALFVLALQVLLHLAVVESLDLRHVFFFVHLALFLTSRFVLDPLGIFLLELNLERRKTVFTVRFALFPCSFKVLLIVEVELHDLWQAKY
jgi:hypothetical protein